jgi:glycogen operon protein
LALDSPPTDRPGAHWDGETTRFVLFSAHATAVELCLFERPESAAEKRRVAMRRTPGNLWWAELRDAGPGTLYGYRVSGPFAPRRGHRFNPAKLLVDPYARAITGEPRLSTALFGGDPKDPRELTYNGEDSAGAMPKCVVVDPAFDWRGDRPPGTPWRDTVIYECHVKGMTRLHPRVEERHRGRYLGLASPPVIEHLLALGVTAVELLPIHQVATEPFLLHRGLRNYWGYSPLGYFAPHAGYATGATGEQVREVKTMVRELHRAGIEVLIDVVLNHTAEGDHTGPTLSLRGIDNRGYYRLKPRRPGRYVDLTGCGNTLDVRREPVRRLILDALRHWVEEMHVDGFRFDLAPVLGRDGGKGGDDFDPEGELLAAIAEDPVLAGVKLIAEPWDLGPGGYRLGGFPEPWREWNDRFRDAARRFWRGDGDPRELAPRIAGSPDLLGDGEGRSVHYVTCHDGFTLADLVSYEHKVNEMNGEDNRDGTDQNLSRNWGQEGPTDHPGIRAARDRARRNLLATLLLARGVPMLRHGDELGVTQNGNNNAYCQDNPLSWLDWSRAGETAELRAFLIRLLEIRRSYPELRTAADTEIRWRHPDGREAPAPDWPEPVLGARFAPNLLLLMNGTPDRVGFQLPSAGDGDGEDEKGSEWRELVHTGVADVPNRRHRGRVEVDGWSVVLLRGF